MTVSRWTGEAGLDALLAGYQLAALTHAESSGAGVRLSVWRWRTAAIALYASHGFTEVPSWDDRHDLLCLRRGA